MLVFPNAKINIGLYITGKREDGFHNIETVFYPVSSVDALEFIETGESTGTKLQVSGIPVDDSGDNLCIRAWQILNREHKLPGIAVHLHKCIPIGAGLGGGSSDAAFMLRALNEYFDLGISGSRLTEYASRLGSDCAFFINNKPSFATGRGDILEETVLSLAGYTLVLVYPNISVSTAEAYSGIVAKEAPVSLREAILRPPEEWAGLITNDFEKPVFSMHPRIAEIKKQLYQSGAVYASMSGSGSSVFGIFDEPPGKGMDYFKDFSYWKISL